MGSYVRGRLVMAGLGGHAPVGDVLDVLTVIVMETPGEALGKWRDGIDRVVARARHASASTAAPSTPDRATWGLLPDQAAATQRLMGGG